MKQTKYYRHDMDGYDRYSPVESAGIGVWTAAGIILAVALAAIVLERSGLIDSFINSFGN